MDSTSLKSPSQNPPKLPRPLDDLVAAFRDNLQLLKDYADRAFKDSNDAYLGEVAGKLRLLFSLKDSGLIYRLLTACKLPEPTISYGILDQQHRAPLTTYMQTQHGTVTPYAGGARAVTVEGIIKGFAETLGAAHQDPAPDHFVGKARSVGAVRLTLCEITSKLIAAAEEIDSALTPNAVASATWPYMETQYRNRLQCLDDPLLRFNLAIALLHQQKCDEAIDHFRTVDQQRPREPQVLLPLGICLATRQRGDDVSQARALFEELLDITPMNGVARYGLAYCNAVQLNLENALLELERLVDRRANFASASPKLDSMSLSVGLADFGYLIRPQSEPAFERLKSPPFDRRFEAVCTRISVIKGLLSPPFAVSLLQPLSPGPATVIQKLPTGTTQATVVLEDLLRHREENVPLDPAAVNSGS